jgi:hypothetical protein
MNNLTSLESLTLSKIDTKIIATFGYGNRKNYDALSNYIQQIEIATIADVRSSPKAWTRKWYGDALKSSSVPTKKEDLKT